MLGDLPAEKIQELLKSKYRMEYFIDAKVFVFNEATNRVEYKETYDHLAAERFEPSNLGKLDGNLLASLTNWLPGVASE